MCRVTHLMVFLTNMPVLLSHPTARMRHPISALATSPSLAVTVWDKFLSLLPPPVLMERARLWSVWPPLLFSCWLSWCSSNHKTNSLHYAAKLVLFETCEQCLWSALALWFHCWRAEWVFRQYCNTQCARKVFVSPFNILIKIPRFSNVCCFIICSVSIVSNVLLFTKAWIYMNSA